MDETRKRQGYLWRRAFEQLTLRSWWDAPGQPHRPDPLRKIKPKK